MTIGPDELAAIVRREIEAALDRRLGGGGTVPTWLGISTRTCWPILGYPAASGTTEQPRTHFQVAQAYGALPATFPAAATLLRSTADGMPALMVRYSS